MADLSFRNTRRFAPLSDAEARALIAAILVAHVTAWTLYGTIAFGFGGVHGDMAEAWVWGQELQLGYFKHPPLWAWVTHEWFDVFPRANWSYYLLSTVNAAAGLWGVWCLAGLFLGRVERLAAVLLLMLTPFYGFLALKFNANTMLLSLWPWTTYFFVRSLVSRKAFDSIMLGLFCSLGMLSKYYTLLLLVTLFVAALLSVDRRFYFRSAAPYISATTGALVLLPHIWWSILNHDALTYAADRLDFTALEKMRSALETAVAPIANCGVAAVVLLVALRLPAAVAMHRLTRWATTPANRWITALTFLVLFLTVAVGFLGIAKVSVGYTIPTFYMVPIFVLSALGQRLTERGLMIIAGSVALVLVTITIGSPAIAYARFQLGSPSAIEPRMEVADAATSLWHAEMPGTLRIVAGSKVYAESISFYSPDSPSEFIDFNYTHAPWITAERIRKQGLLIVCVAGDRDCFMEMNRYTTSASKTFTRQIVKLYNGENGPAKQFNFALIPPQ